MTDNPRENLPAAQDTWPQSEVASRESAADVAWQERRANQVANTADRANLPADPRPIPSGIAGDVNQAVNVTVNNTISAPPVQFITGRTGHSLVTRFIWFIFIGWWLSALFIFAGYLFAATLILLPVGIWFLHRVPQAQTLRNRSRAFTQEFRDGVWVVTEGNKQQFPLWARALYTFPIGLILGLVWLSLAWLVSLPIITLPLSIWMIDRAPTVITLQQH